jgi:hypothetical protein
MEDLFLLPVVVRNAAVEALQALIRVALILVGLFLSSLALPQR